jgi:hypothetical protein
MTSRLILFVTVITLLLFGPPAAIGGFYTGNELVELMREADKADAGNDHTDWVKANQYLAYIIGVYDATEEQYNTPDALTTGQIRAIVTKYLKNNPDKWSRSASDLAKNALKEAFPMGRNK